MAGEGVRLLSDENLSSVEGLGTGKLQEHYEAIVAAGGKFFLSGMSAKARGFDQALIDGRPAEFAMPDVLVRLLVESDKTLTY